MFHPRPTLLRCIIIAFLLIPALSIAEPVSVVFMVPAEQQIVNDPLPLYRLVEDSSEIDQYLAWMDNEPARYALGLYDMARTVVESTGRPCSQPPEFYIALEPGGNYADLGFRLKRGDDISSYPNIAYLKLGPREWRFDITLLHETGHAVVKILASGNDLPKKRIASISHSTAALTNRTTAFDEGFAIHLETLAIHLSDDRHLRNKYRHEQSLFGTWPGFLAEYYRQSSDLMSYSQSVARYYSVRENAFAFESACQQPDYLRVQLEKERDYSTLRNANQLLQSEGFYASFFFSLMTQGKSLPTAEVVVERRDRMLAALQGTLSDYESLGPDTPYLLRFVESYRNLFPEEAAQIVDILLDLSHGVFIDSNADNLWREHYLAALRLDQNKKDRERIEAIREAWRIEALNNPQVLYSRLGPQIVCTVDQAIVELPIFNLKNPVSFDANTAQKGILRLIPGITEAEVDSWIQARQQTPFASVDDLSTRCGLRSETLDQLSSDEDR
ncbi:MAG: hypothetical protein JSU74_13885 [Candidatus Zixiibacteriota bacterium]|nr:MAG: hypothetical protein JSU74_13885 [candidate division Zixibacteria bacterium]